MEATIDYGPGNAAAKVSLAAGETFTAEGGAMIAMSGDMSIETTTHKKGSGGILKAAKRMLAGESFFLNHFTAGPEGGEVWLATGWQGFKSLLSGESMFWLHLSGAGKVILNSFGAIYPVEVAGDHIVDTGHIVAFNETLDFKITKAGKSWISSILGGEGLVCRFHGQGTVWCQSHNAVSFGTTLGRMLRPR